MKALEGTSRADRIRRATRAGHCALEELPGPPAWLSSAARAEWDATGGELVAGRMLASTDLAVLAGYCECVAEIAQLSGMVSEATAAGTLLARGKAVSRLHPALAARREAYARLVAFSAQLGLSPAERVRVRPLPASATADPMDPMERPSRDPLQALMQRQARRRQQEEAQHAEATATTTTM
jgi:P27 family predicted phage terminase small subunit